MVEGPQTHVPLPPEIQKSLENYAAIEYVDIDGQKYVVKQREVQDNKPTDSDPASHAFAKHEKYITLEDGTVFTVEQKIQLKAQPVGPLIYDLPIKTRVVPVTVEGIRDNEGKFHPIKKGNIDREGRIQPTRQQVLDELLPK